MHAADIGVAFLHAGNGVTRIENIVLVYVEAAGLAELLPFGEALAVLVVNQDQAVAAIGDEDAALAVHRQAVAAVEGNNALAAQVPGLEELARLVELHDARRQVRQFMAVSDEDVAIGRGDDVRRLVEAAVVGAVLAGRAKLQ